MKIVISSGHSKYVRGAQGIISEVTEARKVVEKVAEFLRPTHSVITYQDDVSHTQDENLSRIVDFHNAQGAHDLDISVHFNNAYDSPYPNPIGTECFHYSGNAAMRDLAAAVASEIAMASGLKDRGAKDDGLYFTSHTEADAILIEVCFVESEPDVDCYRRYFAPICEAIAAAITGNDIEVKPPPLQPPEEVEPPEGALFYAKGKCSTFGGPDDEDPDNALAFFYEYSDAPSLFLIDHDPNDLFHSLNPAVYYLACRWDYDITPKEMLRNTMIKALVRANGREWLAHPSDFGPHGDTDRVVDLSPGLAAALCVETDDIVEVIYPAPFAVA
jgi:N-acetylmuramoyl-L-alanine amidase